MMSLSKNFLSHFACILDSRKDTHNKRHQLPDILVLTILASLCAAQTMTDVEEFGKSKDVSFNEKQCRVRKDNAPENFSIIRHIALGMLKNERTAKVGLNIKRNKAGWDNRYLIQILKASDF